MNKIHLSKTQTEAIEAFKKYFTRRPSVKTYKLIHSLLLLIEIDKVKINSIPNTRKGYNKNELKLGDNFDALVDLPPGYAVVSTYDSGGNHVLENAATTTLRNIWNSWK